MKRRLVCFGILLLALGQAIPVLAQTDRSQFIRHQTLKPGIHFKTWSFSESSGLDSFTEFALPVVYSHPINERLAIDVITAPFISSVKQTGGETVDLTGLTDTFVRGSYLIGDNLALLTVGLSLPSGKTDLDARELQLAGLAANRPLDNPVTNFGTGLNLNVGLATAQQWGEWVVGLGVGYASRGEYETSTLAEPVDISPGNEINLTFGVEREFEGSNGNSKLLADFIYTNYGEDDFAGRQPYEAGDKFLLRGQYLFPLAVFDPVILALTNRFRLDNETSNPALADNGNEFELRATFIQPRSETFNLKYILHAKLYSDTENEAEGALIYGIGGGITLRVTDTISIDPTLIFSTGSINAGPDSEIDVTGIEFSGGVLVRLP